MLLALLVLGVVGSALVVYLDRRPGDAMTLLVLGLVVSFALPQRFVVAGLDTAGAPSLIVGVVLFALWALNRVRPARALDPRPDPTPVLAAIYLSTWLVGFAVGSLRPDVAATPDSLLREVLGIVALLGLLLYCSDAIRTQQDLQRLLRTVTLLGGAVALLGIAQFVLRTDPLNGLQLPLLVEAPTQRAERIRFGFPRVRGTAFHPIEFSVVLSMVLPLAVGFALRSRERSTRILYTLVALLSGIGAMLSISRSGVVAIGAGLLVVAVHLGWRERLRLAGGGVAGILLVFFAVPRLLGTFRSLFLSGDNDPSIANRLDDVPVVLDVLRRSPLVGGDTPSVVLEERLYDNEFFERITSGGLVSLAGLLALVLVPLLLAWARAQLGQDREARTLAGTIAAALTAGIVSLATFDGFFFKLYTTLLLVLVAAGCAAWRLRDEDPAASAAAPVRRRRQSSGRTAFTSSR